MGSSMRSEDQCLQCVEHTAESLIANVENDESPNSDNDIQFEISLAEEGSLEKQTN